MIQLPLCILAALCLQTSTSSELVVQGLQDGESATLLAPGPGPTEDFAHGRIVDAFTGAPLSGATIELWSEEIDDHYGGYHRFGAATSGRDGRFMVRHRDGARSAEKLRVSAPGYLTFTEAAGVAWDTIPLFPAEATAPRVRFVDMELRPIQGARVTSTYTCAHDIPAFEHVSDVGGIVVLEGYGLQDSIPELRVLAPGYAGIKYLDESEVGFGQTFLEAWGDKPSPFCARIRLRRLPGAELRVLGEDGAPLANTVLMVHDGDGHHVVRTDEQGDASIPARYDSGELTIRRLAPDPGPGAYGLALGEGRTTFRLDGTDWPAETPVGRVRFVWAGEGEPEPIEGLQVSHTEGWVDWTDEDGWVELPTGAGYVVPDETDVDAPRNTPPIFILEDQTALVELQRPRTRVLGELTADIAQRVVVQQGASSIEYTAGESAPVTISIRDGEPCSLWFPETDSSTQLILDRLPLDAEDLKDMARRPEIGMSGSRPAHPEAEWRIAIPEGIDVDVGGPRAHELEIQETPERLSIQGRIGCGILMQCSGKGRVTRWVRALFTTTQDAPVVPELPRFAALRFESSEALEVEGYDSLDELGELNPGPFDCVVREPNGRRIGLRLDLEPGAERILRLE